MPVEKARMCHVAFVGVTGYRRFFGAGAAGGAGPKPHRIGPAVGRPSGFRRASMPAPSSTALRS
jgi:hypothetical protein